MLMDIPVEMTAAQLVGHGGLEQIVVRHDLPVPRPGYGDVLIRVEAAAVNNTDINTRKAWYSKGDQDSADASWSGNPWCFLAFRVQMCVAK